MPLHGGIVALKLFRHMSSLTTDIHENSHCKTLSRIPTHKTTKYDVRLRNVSLLVLGTVCYWFISR